MPSSVHITIEEITQADAQKIVNGGFHFSDRKDWSPERVMQELVRSRVAVRVEVDAQIEPLPGAAAAAIRSPSE
jgi:hypothetical protein